LELSGKFSDFVISPKPGITLRSVCACKGLRQTSPNDHRHAARPAGPDYRTLLSQHYFPKVSHQVLILSTDTEIDEQHFSMLQPAIARSDELAFLPEHNRTEIRPGYFGGQNA
jgi:hypothetical protein